MESLAFLAEAYVLGHEAEKGGEAARRAIELARAEGSPFNLGLAERAVSNTVKDLVAGSGIGFENRGTHILKGVPGNGCFSW